ncbi:MAG: tetratricopeptide repeat protein [Acidobacteria bacterium]|nr:tetratricopeptide repeat protein [Acidobacteriota bacterium]
MSIHPITITNASRYIGGVAALSLALLLPTAVRAGSGAQASTTTTAPAADASTAARTAYSAKIAAEYKNHFSATDPFLPTNMTTDNGEFIDPKSYPSAEYCGHCHKESHAEWRESAHSNSVRPIWYQRNVNMLNDEKGIASSRHCEGCHNPTAVAAGALTDGAPRSRSYDKDGITCMVCHSIQSVNKYGTGSYVLAEPAVMVDASGKPIHGPVSDAEILSHLDRHSAAVMKPFYSTPEFCAACHKAALPTMLNGYKWKRAFTVYDEWQNTSFAKQSPLPFYSKPAVSTCQTCHMQREELAALPDPGAKDGKLASHRWLGANSLIPQYYHFDEQAKRIAAYLKNQALNIDIFSVEPQAPTAEQTSLVAPLGETPFTLNSGQRVTVSVVIQNKGIGHSLVPEQRDFYEAWVAFTVKDAAGKTIAKSGYLQANNSLDPSAHSFTNRLINKQGNLNDLHQVWDNRVVAYNNTIQSGRSQLVRYAFTMPRNNSPATVTAAVMYRRFDEHFIDFVMKMPAGTHYQQPIVEMASTTRTLNVGANAAIKPLPDENPEWMRWNNYGIALLDAQQYAASVNAFEQVAKLRPDYADAQTNIAITYIQWEKYNEALPYLQKSMQLAKNNARAMYYLALVQRNEGKVDDAIVNLQQVVAQFPRSRDAHRELGFSYYQQHKYELARAEYETIQTIDPDDLAAHYNLAILYRRLGMKDKARVEAAAFSDEKDDPTASTYALQYLSKHPESAQESIPWHVHDLDRHGADEAEPTLPATAGAVPVGTNAVPVGQ